MSFIIHGTGKMVYAHMVYIYQQADAVATLQTHSLPTSTRDPLSCGAPRADHLCALRCAFSACFAHLQLYQLLSDRFPFWDVDIHQMDSLGASAIRDGIMHGPVLFPLQPWCTSVHPSAQDLILKMLDRNVSRRITAAEALKHPWFSHALQVTPAVC